MDHYVDGAVLANNPCEYALTAINNFFRFGKTITICIFITWLLTLHRNRGNRSQRVYNTNQSTGAQGDSVALVVSIGTGIFPAEELGSTDAQQFLYFGKHWFKSKSGPLQTVENLLTLLTKAVRE